MKEIRIDNSKQSAVKSGKWKNPGSSFYYKILNSFTIADPNRSEEEPGRYDFDFRKVLQEAYLVAPVEKIKNSPYGITPYSQSGCKYPHHVIRNGKLVVSIPGIRAAYARAKQQGIYKGKVKEHIDRHYKEMGLTMSAVTESVDPIQDQIDLNFDFIQKYIESALGVKFVHDDVMMESVDDIVDKEQYIKETFDWMDEILYESDEEYNRKIEEENDKFMKCFNDTDSILLNHSTGINLETGKLVEVFTSTTYPDTYEYITYSILDDTGTPLHDVCMLPTFDYSLVEFIEYLDDKIDLRRFATPCVYNYDECPIYEYRFDTLFADPLIQNEFLDYIKENEIKYDYFEVCDNLSSDTKFNDVMVETTMDSYAFPILSKDPRIAVIQLENCINSIEPLYCNICGWTISDTEDYKEMLHELKEYLDLTTLDTIDEKSNDYLKFDFRLAWDYNTGHQLKIVYSLDDIEITDVGDFAISGTNRTKEEYLKYAKEWIRKRGNLDHQSKGQKVLAIIDMVTGKKLNSCKAVAPFSNYVNTREKIQPNLKKFQMGADENPEKYIANLRVGEVDNVPRYKSTHWFKNNTTDPHTGKDLRFRQLSKAEIYKDGRGNKIDNLLPQDYIPYGSKEEHNIFRNPNKKQAIDELKLRYQSAMRKINVINAKLSVNAPMPEAYRLRLQHNLAIQQANLNMIIKDIKFIQNNKNTYNPSIMDKYRKNYTEQYAQNPDMTIPVDITLLEKIDSDPNHRQAIINHYETEFDNLFNLSSYLEADDQSEENDQVEEDDTPPNIDLGDEEIESDEPPTIDTDEPESTEEDPSTENEPEEDPKEDTTNEAPSIIEPTSLPKAADAQETDKNGVNRKKLYIAFIEWAKSYNARNTFGSLFDKEVFDVTYPFVPHEMRYFYRLANPILCVLSGKLTFFQVSELRKLNADNPDMKDALIFAATENDYRAFSTRDKRVYLAVDKPDGSGIQFTRALADSFDLYIQNMIGKGDILHGDVDSSTDSGTDRGDHSDENGE